MSKVIIQKADLAASSFSNDNTNASGGIKVRVDAGSEVGDAIAANQTTLLAPSAEFTTAVQAAETTTTLAVSGVNYRYTNEDAIQTVIQPGQFLSTDAGQSLTTDAQGRLFVNVIGLLPADASYSGSNVGTVDITIEPDITDPTLFTIKGDLDLAATTPTGGDNLLVYGSSGFYVSAEEVAAEIAGTPAAAATIQALIPDATDTVKGIASTAVAANFPSTSDTEHVSPAYLNAALAAFEVPPGLIVSATAPASPAVGAEWYDIDNTGRTYVWTGTEWADENPAGAGDGAGGIPPGTVIHVVMATAPAGYLKADGLAVSRTTYAALWAALGSPNTGDGSTTFTLPDLRGEFIRGWDDGRGVDAGRALLSAQASAFGSHTHTGSTSNAGTHGHSGSTDSAGNHRHDANSGAPGLGQGTAGPNSVQQNAGSELTSFAGSHSHSLSISGAGDHNHSLTIGATGGTETRPRNVALLACIKF